MIGCLAIGIPLKFGLKGMAAYGQTTLWVALVTVSWSVILAVFVKLTTETVVEADRFVLRIGVADGVWHGRIL